MSIDQPEEELAQALRAVTFASEDASAKYSYDVRHRALYDDLSSNVVPPAHAIEAAANADASVIYEWRDNRVFVATKALEANGRSFCLISFGDHEAAARDIKASFRLYSTSEQVKTWSAEPTQALCELLMRYGVPYTSNGRRVRFVPVHTAPFHGLADAVRLLEMLGLDADEMVTPDKSWIINASFRNNQDGTATLAWPFVVDRNLYLKDVRARRG